VCRDSLLKQTSLIQLVNRQPHHLLVKRDIEFAPDNSSQLADVVLPITMPPHCSRGLVQAVRFVVDQIINEHLVREGMDQQPFFSRSK